MNLQPGDILAFHGRGLVASLIRAATWSPWLQPHIGPSHVGIVLSWGRYADRHLIKVSPNEEQPRPEHLMLESTTLTDHPCRFARERRSGVQLQLVRQRIADYGGQVDVYRLTQPLTDLESEQLDDLATEWLRVRCPYDLFGAAQSGTRIWRWLPWLPNTDQQMFCSEMIARLLYHVERWRVRNPDRLNPGSLLRWLLVEGIYRPVGRYE